MKMTPPKMREIIWERDSLGVDLDEEFDITEKNADKFLSQ